MERIPFNRPAVVGQEHAYIDAAIASGHLSGNGGFARRCTQWLEEHLGAPRALLTPSCTAALEMAALLCEPQPGDEVIVPSFTFVSTAAAFALHGFTPVFVDIDRDTLGLDAERVEAAVTERTRAIVVVHYGGVACDVEEIAALADRAGIVLVEDAAHALPASLHGRRLGSFGQLSTFSFHETKNVQCGEGGALVVNDPALVARAEILQEKGTDRARFFRGETDRYTWRDLGSSYLLSEVSAAFLWAQIEQIAAITRERRRIWERYHAALAGAAEDGLLRRPVVPPGHEHSGHVYALLARTCEERDRLIAELSARGIHAVFHYVPLHGSPAGSRVGRVPAPLPVTEDVSARLVRLPLWYGLEDADVDRIAAAVDAILREAAVPSPTPD